MRYEFRDKPQKRIAAVVSLLFGLILYSAMYFRFFGEEMARFSGIYLAAILVVLGGRAILTEVGIRRRPFEWERKLDKRFRFIGNSSRENGKH